MSSGCSIGLRLALVSRAYDILASVLADPNRLSDQPEHYAGSNPTGAVSTLVLQAIDGNSYAITQSSTAMERLDEVQPL